MADHGGPPVVMLSALGEDVDRIVGLELGAADYLCKPAIPANCWRASARCCTSGLVLAQAATVSVLLIAPPPRPPVYLVSDVAAALRGGPLRSDAGWRLARSHSLGLAVARSIVREHGGDVRLTSQPDGLAAIFSFP